MKINRVAIQALYDLFSTLPKDYKKFDMENFCVVSKDGKILEYFGSPCDYESYVKEGCNTCMCLLGHLPTVKGYEALSSDKYWTDYTKRVLNIDMDCTIFEFLFDGRWKSCVDLALARMKCVLENKPFAFSEDTVANPSGVYCIANNAQIIARIVDQYNREVAGEN